jgi:hypothetical protein
MSFHNFKFNYMRVSPGEYDIWGMACKRNILNEISPTKFRNLRFQYMSAPYQYKNNGCEVIEHGGWHFGYMGDNAWLADKARNFAHTEVNRPEFIEQIDLENSIANRQHWGNFGPERYAIVELNDYFPKSVLHYPAFILDNPEANPYNLLPPFPYQWPVVAVVSLKRKY